MKVKIAAAGKIMEIGTDPEDEGSGWRQMPWDAQGPGLVTSKAGNLEQLFHSD